MNLLKKPTNKYKKSQGLFCIEIVLNTINKKFQEILKILII